MLSGAANCLQERPISQTPLCPSSPDPHGPAADDTQANSLAATTVIPQNEYAEKAATSSLAPERTTRSSYAEAAAICRTKVRKIANECRAINRKYRDPHFDLEVDLKLNMRDCLESLSNSAGAGGGGGDDEPDAQPPPLKPMGVKRVADIFDEPQFYIDGPTTNDVRQGKGGDCWLLACVHSHLTRWPHGRMPVL